MKITKGVKDWLASKGLGQVTLESVDRKVHKRIRGRKKTKKGATHAVNPVWKPGIVGIPPASYRHNHMGLPATKRAKLKRASKPVKGGG